MKRLQSPAVWGVLLVVAGILALLQNFGLLGGFLDIVWALMFGAAGAAFLYVFIADRTRWWAVIPGGVLLGLAITVLTNTVSSKLGDAIGGTAFLGAIGLSFWAVYAMDRARWWAIIPGGVLVTLAVVSGIDALDSSIDTGGIFFLGLGGTFLLLSLVPTERGRIKWATIPAAILLIMGIVLVAEAASALSWVVPALVILAGFYFLLRGVRSQPKE